MSATDQTTFLVKYGRQTITINIDPEFKSLIAPLSDLEFNQLKENIRTDVDGVREPLAVWAFGSCDEEGQPTYVLLDGHHRYRAWKELSDEGEVLHALRIFTPIIGDTRDAALLWIEENQIGRRNLTDDQRAVIWESIRERRSAIASKEGAAKARAAKVDSAKTTETEAPSTPAKRDTRKEVARESGLPESKLRTVARLKKENPTLVHEVRSGRTTLREATKQSKPASKPTPAPTILTVKELLDWNNAPEFHDGLCDISPTFGSDEQVDLTILALDPITAKKLVDYYLELKKARPVEPPPVAPTPMASLAEALQRKKRTPEQKEAVVDPVDIATMDITAIRLTPEYAAWNDNDVPMPPEMTSRYQQLCAELRAASTCTAICKNGKHCAIFHSIKDGLCPIHDPKRTAERAVIKTKQDLLSGFENAYNDLLLAIEFPEADDAVGRKPTPEEKRTAFQQTCAKFNVSHEEGLQILTDQFSSTEDLTILRKATTEERSA
jgi:hypothetical protein